MKASACHNISYGPKLQESALLRCPCKSRDGEICRISMPSAVSGHLHQLRTAAFITFMSNTSNH